MACAEFGHRLWWLLAAGLLVRTPALADTYKWVDEKGHVQYTDRLPPEAVNRRTVELSKQGMTRKVIEPPMTPEQRQAEEERKEQEKKAQRALVEQRNQETALLSSYTSESDIDLARRRNLALVGAGILSAEARIRALQRRQAVLEREQLFYEKKPFPERMKRELVNIKAEIPKQYALIEQKNQDALAVIKHYDELKTRYTELKTRIARETATAKKQ